MDGLDSITTVILLLVDLELKVVGAGSLPVGFGEDISSGKIFMSAISAFNISTSLLSLATSFSVSFSEVFTKCE